MLADPVIIIVMQVLLVAFSLNLSSLMSLGLHQRQHCR